MSNSRGHRWSILLVTIGLMAVVPVGASAQTQQDVDKAAHQKKVAEARQSQAYKDYQRATTALEDAVVEYEALWAEREELEYRITRMEDAASRYQDEADALEERAKLIVIDAYTSGQTDLVGTAFAASTIQDLVTTTALLGKATERDLASLDNLDAVSRQAERSSAELDLRRADVLANQDSAAIIVEAIDLLRDEATAILEKADGVLREAISAYRREVNEKKSEEERIKRQKAEQSASRSGAAGGAKPEETPGFICPVQGGASFIDSWGFARSGGRKHKGVDMFNSRNTPLIAVVDGRVTLDSNRVGGTSVHIYAPNGTVYYYTHLEGHATNLQSGQQITKGTVVGYLGNSGNARYTSPHLHFEIRPNGKAVNPYPTVRSAC